MISHHHTVAKLTKHLPTLLATTTHNLIHPPHSFYATKTRRSKNSVLLQDPDRVPIFKSNTSAASDRRVYVWGLSETGALGLHKSLKKQSQKQAALIQHPTRLPFAEQHQVLDIAAGYGFTAFAVKHHDGISLFGCGINTDSQLGYQHQEHHREKTLGLIIYPAPIQLPVVPGAAADEGGLQIQRCAAGRAHLLALDAAGRVYALGNNAYGQCGRPIIADESYTGSQTVHIIDGIIDDTATTDGNERSRIVDIHCGQDHSLLLTDNGRVYACGWGADGQTGLGHYASVAQPTRVRGDIEGERIVRVAGSVDCVLALNDRGEVFGWGNSEYGQLVSNEADVQQICAPMAVAALKGCGRIVDIAAGGSSCVAVNGERICIFQRCIQLYNCLRMFLSRKRRRFRVGLWPLGSGAGRRSSAAADTDSGHALRPQRVQPELSRSECVRRHQSYGSGDRRSGFVCVGS